MSGLNEWIKTRRGGSLILAFVALLVVGSIVTIIALTIADVSGSARLAVAGSFASGVAALFGLAAVSAALLANYVVANRDSRDAEDAWSKKLRLEEALAFYPGLVITAVRQYKEETNDSTFSSVGLHPLVREARVVLRDALRDVRETGFVRVLSQISRKEQIDDLGELLLMLEANVVNDIESANPGIGQAVAILMSQTALLDHLPLIDYDDIAKFWNKPWLKLGEAKIDAARMIG